MLKTFWHHLPHFRSKGPLDLLRSLRLLKQNNLQCGADNQLSFTQVLLRSSDQMHVVKQESRTCALLTIFDWLHPVCHVVDPIDGSSASLVQFGYLLQLGLCSTLSYDYTPATYKYISTKPVQLYSMKIFSLHNTSTSVVVAYLILQDHWWYATLYQILQHLLETSQKQFMNSNMSSSGIATALNIYVWSGAADKSLFLLASIWHMGHLNLAQRNKANSDFEVESKHMDTNLISIFVVQVKQKSYCSKNTNTKQLFLHLQVF